MHALMLVSCYLILCSYPILFLNPVPDSSGMDPNPRAHAQERERGNVHDDAVIKQIKVSSPLHGDIPSQFYKCNFFFFLLSKHVAWDPKHKHNFFHCRRLHRQKVCVTFKCGLVSQCKACLALTPSQACTKLCMHAHTALSRTGTAHME